MTYEIIENLVEKLSCDFVLADPCEPESLSGLLPILKQIHGKCMKLSLKDKAKEILKIRKIIDAVLKDNPGDIDEQMDTLGALISNLSSSLFELKEPDQALNTTKENPPDPVSDGPAPDRIGP